jgi:cytochrome c peroxidase
LPTGVATLGNALYITCAGADLVLEHRLSESYDESPKCFDARKKQRRFSVGKGVRGIAIDPDTKRAYAWSAFDRSISEIDLSTTGTATPRTIKVTTPANEMGANMRLGRELFFATNDPRISNDGRACAGCHPDARQDGLVWPTPKGTRQTPMLAGRVADSAPYDWNGANATIVSHIAQTTKNLHGRGLAETDRAALATYLTSLRGPDRESAKEDDHVARGRTIFESSEAQCSSCHPKESAYADHQTHVLSRGSAAFDTPSLRFVGGTAPYFHDGRYATLDELVEKCDGAMGQTKQLSADQKADLVAFLRTL